MTPPILDHRRKPKGFKPIDNVHAPSKYTPPRPSHKAAALHATRPQRNPSSIYKNESVPQVISEW
ncbi:uncharacterized protein BDZ83DRAFT_601665 [Colletotrichum acutatum]|uniref:Uncharacterized protein n=1 Tax=Glomerella acutata TaxID=27357 RepID=A0AAD8XN92_GLOAC|nr:uncharacterized protein BDZ83DRAFT_601665 [Colletotrichum acutatum]KAK1730592.1 hypothetical protein BDZ83DRAFT_601665 [Colletotrichum acutatum]